MKFLWVAAILSAGLASTARVALATLYAPIPLDDLRALSQSADAVVVARIQKFVPGRPTRQATDGANIEGTAATFVCAVEKSLAGSVSLVGQRRFAYTGGGDFYSWKVTNDSFLFFVRHTKTGYELCGPPMKLKGNVLLGWFEGEDWFDSYTLQKLLPLAKKNIATKVQLFGWVPKKTAAATGVLPTAWTFKNVGSNPISVLPPSLCFNSLQARRLRNGKWYPDLGWWQSVDHWAFYSKQELPVKLAPGEQCTFYYKIPLSQLKMTAMGEYKISFYYHQDQLSKHAQGAGINPAKMDEIWLGEPPLTRQKVWVVAGATLVASQK